MKKIYFLLMAMLTAFAANAVKLSGDVYLWDTSTNSQVQGEEPAYIEAEFEGNGVIKITDFLESEQEITLIVNNTGIVTHDKSAGTWAGTFVMGSYGEVSGIYFYAGQWSYYDFSYYIDNNVKYLHCGVYAPDSRGSWYDLYFALPDDFEPRDPYAEYTKKEVEVTLYDGDVDEDGNSTAGTKETVTAYVKDKEILFPSLFGANITYTFDDNWNLVPSYIDSKNTYCWVASDSYSYGGKTNTWISFYNDTYLTYDARTLSLTDYVWFYTSDCGFYFSFDATDLVTFESDYIAEYQSGRDYLYSDYIKVNVAQGYGTFTIPDFMGSGKTLAIESYDDDTSKVYIDGKDVSGTTNTVVAGTGNITINETEYSLSEINLYLKNGFYGYEKGTYQGEEYEDFFIGAYLGSSFVYFYFYPEDGFTLLKAVKEPEKEPIATEEVIVRLLDSTTGAELTDYTHTATAKTYDDGSIKIEGAFGATFTYTIADDGTITRSVVKDYVSSSTSFTYNGTANSWLYFYGSDSVTYNAETRVIRDYVWFYYSNAGCYFTISFPAEADAVKSISVSDDSNAPVEYFNLQGVRVANPENGLFIRRQGSKVSKVILK